MPIARIQTIRWWEKVWLSHPVACIHKFLSAVSHPRILWIATPICIAIEQVDAELMLTASVLGWLVDRVALHSVGCTNQVLWSAEKIQLVLRLIPQASHGLT